MNLREPVLEGVVHFVHRRRVWRCPPAVKAELDRLVETGSRIDFASYPEAREVLLIPETTKRDHEG